MSKEVMAVIGFGVIGALALVMFVLERRAVAARKAARGGREVDLSHIFSGAPSSEQAKTR